MKTVNGVKISIDTAAEDGTPLNDSPREDRELLKFTDDDDGREILCTDQLTNIVTLDYLERRDRRDRMQYTV